MIKCIIIVFGGKYIMTVKPLKHYDTPVTPLKMYDGFCIMTHQSPNWRCVMDSASWHTGHPLKVYDGFSIMTNGPPTENVWNFFFLRSVPPYWSCIMVEGIPLQCGTFNIRVVSAKSGMLGEEVEPQVPQWLFGVQELLNASGVSQFIIKGGRFCHGSGEWG